MVFKNVSGIIVDGPRVSFRVGEFLYIAEGWCKLVNLDEDLMLYGEISVKLRIIPQGMTKQDEVKFINEALLDVRF